MNVLTTTLLVRCALVLFDRAPRNDGLTGVVHFSPAKTILFPPDDLAISLDAFQDKHLAPAITEWAQTMPRAARFGPGEPVRCAAYEMYQGAGMVGVLSNRADGQAQLILQLFPQAKT